MDKWYKMIDVTRKDDICHIIHLLKCRQQTPVYLKPSIFPLMVLAITVNNTRLIVLMGISMAAIKGDRVPVTAKDSPTKL